MLVHRSRSSGWSLTDVVPWRSVAHRFSYVLFIGLSLFFLILSHAQPDIVTDIRERAIDTLAPVLDAASRPMAAIDNVGNFIRDTVYLRADNARLRAENAHMAEWQNAVVALEKENRELRGLLNFKPEPGFSYISARVIADTGGAYSRGLIVTAGKVDGVRPGMAAMTGNGLIGRVVEVGDWSSRILLITDLNSRIPVAVADTGDRAILAGDNSPEPKLLFMPHDSVAQDGARVVTSGHGGVFPPNLPVGILREGPHNSYLITPSADLGRVTYVRLVDFNLRGDAFNPVEAKIRAGHRNKKK
ncbi:MAG: rod shape-determining protein MreC [Alphaproteobacteria bacterium]|nr:rod shape-determining protein MreC [Alphaproteobacteria bacterium]